MKTKKPTLEEVKDYFKTYFTRRVNFKGYKYIFKSKTNSRDKNF